MALARLLKPTASYYFEAVVRHTSPACYYSYLNNSGHSNYSWHHKQYQYRNYYHQQCFHKKSASYAKYGIISLATGAAFGLYAYIQANPESAADYVEAGKPLDNLPTYTKEQVAKHCSKETKIWVTYKNGVYDITDYVESHPGGKKIYLAAGKSIEPFWSLYAVHKNSEIFAILETYRIGNFKPDEEDSKKPRDVNDPYANDPKRHPALIPSSMKPFNAEPPVEILTEKFVTPKEIFFVRNHLPVPEVNVETYRLDVTTENSKRTVSLSVKDLKKFPKHDVTSVVQCAGNRRSEMKEIKTVKGLNWGNAAIGNGIWSGVRLVDVLKHAGIDFTNTGYKHIQFEGLDSDPTGAAYGASIPIDLFKVIQQDVILAYEMNGEELTADHGYPLRVIIPGVVGARQVKWLKKIILSSEESTSHWQRRDYKGFNSSVDWHNVDFDSAESIQQFPVQSVISNPSQGSHINEDDEEIEIQGYAWSGGGRGIIRVDVSIDGGKTWQTASLQTAKQSLYRTYAWTLWSATVEIPKDHSGTLNLVCKATDISYNTQPDSVQGIWNLRGVLSNAWHRVLVHVNKEEA
ncbi:sulfite oxidase [Octopus bimaculoides]|uniref:sulfite oxidase n=1 Tax=Octopus bimaculoides TaxID=37653 RepID=UPI0022E4D8F7|nr:sulfite oxidase [Octopus bimaculoides]